MEKEEFNKRFGRFVAQKRREYNLSQADLAERMNNNFQNISRIERGEFNPTHYWVYRLSQAFDEDYGDFINEFSDYH